MLGVEVDHSVQPRWLITSVMEVFWKQTRAYWDQGRPVIIFVSGLVAPWTVLDQWHTKVVGARGNIVAISSSDGGLVDHVVGVVGLGGAAVGGDGGGAGALENADVALVEPSAGVLSEDEVTGCTLVGFTFFEGIKVGTYTAPSM